MKITAVESILLTVPYRTSGGLQSIAGPPGRRAEHAAGAARHRRRHHRLGRGLRPRRLRPPRKTAFDTLVAPMLIGRDPSDIDALMHDLQRTLHLFGRNGAVMYALSGVDIALWDIAGKVAGKPLYQLLGGTDARAARLCEPAALLRAGRGRVKLRARARAGLSPHQAARDHGAGGEGGARRGRAGRPADARHQLSVERRRSARDGAALRPFDLHWLEEPVWPPEDHAGLAKVRAAGAVDRGGRERRRPARVSPRVRARARSTSRSRA